MIKAVLSYKEWIGGGNKTESYSSYLEKSYPRGAASASNIRKRYLQK